MVPNIGIVNDVLVAEDTDTEDTVDKGVDGGVFLIALSSNLIKGSSGNNRRNSLVMGAFSPGVNKIGI